MKQIHIYLFGIGNVGSTLIKQVLDAQTYFKRNQHIDLRIVALANSTKVLFKPEGIDQHWRNDFALEGKTREADSFYQFSRVDDQEKIAVDATASQALSLCYPELIQHGFHVVTANKIANTLGQNFYDQLRMLARQHQRSFAYETNVGAGLPIVQSIADLVACGEEIFTVNGVFSGSLSYIFNRFSEESQSFSSIVLEALSEGYTEPDPREDLAGNDVARKLLVLARETGLKLELEDIEVEDLIIPDLKSASLNQFLTKITALDPLLEQRKRELKPHQVLRHLGELDVQNAKLQVRLKAVDRDSPAGQLQGSDGFFEIYSESYAAQPLVIKGAGAGKLVTARGLLSDVIKVAKTNCQKLIEV
ncbi:homoserine dehydrogenase family protein [Nonlabens xiamenensis]|uniref:aspartate kinase n=1 Tax=Nonlabens xiamenensis TaxID=2341043 RepID=UPI000F607AA4|nr:aspartate kinase [Nonlabens xiamenensis]